MAARCNSSTAAGNAAYLNLACDIILHAIVTDGVNNALGTAVSTFIGHVVALPKPKIEILMGHFQATDTGDSTSTVVASPALGVDLRLDQLSNGPRGWPHGNAAYLYGSHFLKFVFDRYGDDKAAVMSHDYGSTAIPYGINRSIERGSRAFIDEYVKTSYEHVSNGGYIEYTDAVGETKRYGPKAYIACDLYLLTHYLMYYREFGVSPQDPLLARVRNWFIQEFNASQGRWIWSDDPVIKTLLAAQGHLPPTELVEVAGFTGTAGTIGPEFECNPASAYSRVRWFPPNVLTGD